MRIWIDGQEWLAEGADKAVLWSRLNEDARRQGRVPQRLFVDGEEITPEVFCSMTGGQEIRIETKAIRELVRESLEDAVAYVPSLLKGFAEIADALEAEQKDKALPKLQDASEGIGWLLKVAENAKILLSVGPEELGGEELDETLKGLSSALAAVVTALESGKYYEIAYRVREEVSPLVGRTLPFLRRLGEIASEGVQ